jgi:zinc protease
MKRVFLAFTVVLAVLNGAWVLAQAEPIVTYALDNGLQVVLVPDHHAPKVVMNLRYRVGSMNEPAGRSGFAHLFEHLMFSGTPAWPNVFGAHAALEGEQTAMRALDLLGGKQQAPLSASPWRVGDGGTTRAVHSCTSARDCGAQIHAD